MGAENKLKLQLERLSSIVPHNYLQVDVTIFFVSFRSGVDRAWAK
jgi:hypothetical protein